jgi:hypothetical protein
MDKFHGKEELVVTTNQESDLPPVVVTEMKELEKEANKDLVAENMKYIEKESEMLEKSKHFSKNPGDILLCLSVDGSDSSDHAFDMFYKECMGDFKNHFKMLVMHVYNDALDENYNYRNKKKTVISNYDLRTSKIPPDQCLFYYENRVSKLHALEQVCTKANEYNADYLISGYYGIKGPRGSSQELSKGIDYLLLYARAPTIIIKELHLRNKPEGKGFKWLFVFDKTYINCLKILKTFFPLVDKKVDFISALTMIPTYVFYDDVKNAFHAEMERHNFTNFKYESVEYKKNPGDIVINMINYGEDNLFDFVVIFNNPQKHKVEGEHSDTLKVVKNALCNICFLNGMA